MSQEHLWGLMVRSARSALAVLALKAPAIAMKAAPRDRRSVLVRALGDCRGAFVGVAVLSGVLNILYLTGSLFMLEVYDRVIPSQSVPTLVGLVVIAATLYGFQGALDVIRARILTRIGSAIDIVLSGPAFQALTRLPLVSSGGDSIQPARDLDTVRGFLSGLGPTVLFDLPWMPLYLGICFAFHPAIGWTATGGGLLLIALTLLTERLTRAPVRSSSLFNSQRYALAENLKRNAEVLRAMGMETRMGQALGEINACYRSAQQRAADIGAGLGAASKTMRMLLQSAVLAVGAYLVINHEATSGIIIASSILTSRALAPIELAIGQWKGFVAARQSWQRLDTVFAALPAEVEQTELPAPAKLLSVEAVSVAAPGGRSAIVQDASFLLEAGSGLGIIGPSASGKSSLVRAIVGAWTPVQGAVRLDGAAIQQWSPERLGRHVGYLPQDVQLFGGTVAHNICRFDIDASAEDIVTAAKVAGVHDMIVRLPQGYETPVGEGGLSLSAGQRQRIGLARAVYGNPFLVVLDEPNSNLDSEGEESLTRAIISIRSRGGIVIVVAHRPSALLALNMILMMADGRVQSFGPKEEVLGKVLQQRPPAAAANGQEGIAALSPRRIVNPYAAAGGRPQ